MKSPAYIGLPPKFSSWRRGQLESVRSILHSPHRFDLLCLPTGVGKSATYMSYFAIDEGRMAILTPTKALQDQVSRDFHAMGLVDIRGRSNYVCDIDSDRTADDAVCTTGVFCSLSKYGGCKYYDQVKRANDSNLVLTNYKFWLHAEESGRLGEFNTLVMDEAHNAPDEISDFAAVEASSPRLRAVGVSEPPTHGWAGWAAMAVEDLERRVEQIKGEELARKARRLLMDLRRLGRLSEHDWLYTRRTDRRKERVYRWDLIEPGAVAEELLFRGAKKVILSSASIRRKTLRMLGVHNRGVTVIEQSSPFPVKRRPVYYWPVARLSRKAGDGDLPAWYRAIDEIIGARLDRKGVIHGVSYKRGTEIVRNSRFRDSGVFLFHERGQKADSVLEEFFNSAPPKVLVSPAMTEGLSFDFDKCEYSIIAKVPFPDMSSPLVQARLERDRDYTAYVAMQAVVQAAGRGMRAEDDSHEAIILDKAFGWLRGAYRDFAPRWFHAAVRTIDKDGPAPEPLPKLEPGKGVDKWATVE